MPKRTDIHKILIIGAGPIIIGQACEFDYSGTQACKALKEEGYEVVLVNSNPATIMTDPEMADRTYIEPVAPQTVARIIEKEHPCALLPTLGGQTGLNTAVEVAGMGVLDKVVLEFPYRFWDESFDSFGYIADDRGKWAQWYDLEEVTGKPIVVAFHAGSVADRMLGMSDDEITAEAMTVLRTIYP